MFEIGHEMRSLNRPLSNCRNAPSKRRGTKLWLVNGAIVAGKLVACRSRLVSAVDDWCWGSAAVAWAVLRVQLPPADFTFVNESEVASVDPALITGKPEGRICSALLRRPDAATVGQSATGAGRRRVVGHLRRRRTYTFHLRPDAKWSNGDPVTAHDFHYSLRRLLDPLTASRYAYQAWYIKNAKRYTSGGSGTRARRSGRGRAESAGRCARTRCAANCCSASWCGSTTRHRRPTASRARATACSSSTIDGKERRFQAADVGESLAAGVEPCRQVLLDSAKLGIRVVDDHTLEIGARESDAVFSRSAGVLSAVAGAPRVPRKVRHAGLDAAGEHRHQRRVSAHRAPAPRSHPAHAQPELLGPRECARQRDRRACRSTIARRR